MAREAEQPPGAVSVCGRNRRVAHDWNDTSSTARLAAFYEAESALRAGEREHRPSADASLALALQFLSGEMAERERDRITLGAVRARRVLARGGEDSLPLGPTVLHDPPGISGGGGQETPASRASTHRCASYRFCAQYCEVNSCEVKILLRPNSSSSDATVTLMCARSPRRSRTSTYRSQVVKYLPTRSTTDRRCYPCGAA